MGAPSRTRAACGAAANTKDTTRRPVRVGRQVGTRIARPSSRTRSPMIARPSSRTRFTADAGGPGLRADAHDGRASELELDQDRRADQD